MTSQTHSERTLVLGAAIGYSVEDVRPFLVSLKNSGYQGDVALLADLKFMDASRPLLANVILVPAASWAFGMGARLRKSRAGRILVLAPWQLACWLLLKFLGIMPFRPDTIKQYKVAWAQCFFHPMLSRLFHYQKFLKSRPYTKVLLTDVRDVLFQSDPFEHLPETGLGVSIEAAHYTIATQYWNALWIRTTYGADVLNEIGMKPVSCAGVTYGDYSAINHYLDLMVDEIINLGFRAVFRVGDQAVHNYLVWTGRLDPVSHFNSLDSAVATLNDTNCETLKFNVDGKLLNHDGSIVSIVHQYDRLPAVADNLLKAVMQ